MAENIASFVISGQSLAWRLAEDANALAAFEAEFLAHNPQYTGVEFFNAAVRSSTVLRGAAEYRAEYRNDPEAAFNYWYDEATGSDGPNLTDVLAELAAWVQGRNVLGIIWDHGQAETAYVTAGQIAADFTAGTHHILSRLMELSGAESVYIQGFGDRGSYYPGIDQGSDLMHALQQEFSDNHAYATLVSATYDLPLADSIHFTPAGFVTAAIRLARGISTGEISPEVERVMVSSDGAIFVTIGEQGRGLSLAEGSTAFRLYAADGSEVAIASVLVDSATGLIAITPVNPGAATLLRYASALFSFELEGTEVLLSNGLPVQPFNADLQASAIAIVPEDAGYRLTGGEADDWLIGFRSDDILVGGGGNDVLEGSAGDDTYIVIDLGDSVRELPGGGQDSVMASISFRLPHDVENLSLGDGAGLVGSGNGLGNLLVGGTGADVLRAYAGNDALRGEAGDDRMFGHAGDDRLFGEAGGDLLDGGEGNDFLRGGAGRDRLFGGAGADVFQFRPGESPGLTRNGADVICDFDRSQADRVDLSEMGALSFIATAAFSGEAGELRYRHGTNATFIEGDLDGDGVADFMIQMLGLVELTSSDFIL